MGYIFNHEKAGQKFAFWIVTFVMATGIFFLSLSSTNAQTSKSTKSSASNENETPRGPLFSVVSLQKQNLVVYGPTGAVAQTPVSTGRKGYSTPTGIFSILEKRRFHRSNLYYNAPMPFMQRLTWSGVALHAGVLPGYPASHGCIRLPSAFAKRYFELTKSGQKVIVTRHEVTPVEFRHPRLPEPKFFPPLDGPPSVQAQNSLVKINMASAETNNTSQEGSQKTAGNTNPPPQNSSVTPLNPIEFAKAMRTQALSKVKQANLTLEAAEDAVPDKALEVREAVGEHRKASIALMNAQDRIETLSLKLSRSKAEDDIKALTAATTAAEAQVAEIQARVAAAEVQKAEKAALAAKAAKAVRQAEEAKQLITNDVRLWTRRLEPVSVFISAKTNRLYVRQGLTKVFDTAVTVKDPQTPLGTHVYIATGQADGAKLHWMALSLTPQPHDEELERKRDKKTKETVEAPKLNPSTSAAQALDRIDIPNDIAEKLSELLWTGGTFIVSDHAISQETNDFTDFIILTRH